MHSEYWSVLKKAGNGMREEKGFIGEIKQGLFAERSNRTQDKGKADSPEGNDRKKGKSNNKNNNKSDSKSNNKTTAEQMQEQLQKLGARHACF